MLKKMRWHFILAAMAAVFIMLVVVLAGVNVWNYHNTASRADQRIQEIYTFEAGNGADAAGETGSTADASKNSEIPPVNAANTSNPPTGQTETLPPVFPGPGQERDPEAPYTTRFFLVKLDENEEITKVSTDFIASVTQEEAKEYAQNILNGKRKKGYYKNYRFQILSDNNGKIVIFLNCSMELHSAWNVLVDFLPDGHSVLFYCVPSGAASFQACHETLHPKYGAPEAFYYRCKPRDQNPSDIHCNQCRCDRNGTRNRRMDRQHPQADSKNVQNGGRPCYFVPS